LVCWLFVHESETFVLFCYQKAVFFLRKLASQPLLLYTVFWTLMLAATVTVAALSLEMGFSTAISPHMELAEACALQSNKASPSCRQLLSVAT
jgi:hypothetical protein